MGRYGGEGGQGIQARKERKVTRVMGCALSRQLRLPGGGASMSAMLMSVNAGGRVLPRSMASMICGLWTFDPLGHMELKTGDAFAQGSGLRHTCASNASSAYSRTTSTQTSRPSGS